MNLLLNIFASNTFGIPTFLLIVIALVVYFIPVIIGWKKSNGLYIILMNLFLGWTIIGWFFALSWALIKEKSYFFNEKFADSDSDFYKPERLRKLREAGIISEDEYLQKINNIA